MNNKIIKKINDDVTLERSDQGLVNIHVKDKFYQRNPMYDRQFKYFFCNEEGKKYALRLINDLLMKRDEERFVSIEFVNTEFQSNDPKGKRCIVDFLVKTNSGEFVHIEVQLRLHKFIMERIFAYWHLINANLAKPQKGEDYSKCSKVVSILLSDDDLFIDQKYYRSFFLLPVTKDPITYEDLLPTDPSIIQECAKFGYVSVFEVNKFHDYMLKLSKEHDGDQSYIKALKRFEQWLLFFHQSRHLKS